VDGPRASVEALAGLPYPLAEEGAA